MTSAKATLIVIGSGIIGLATAFQYMKQNPDNKVILLEKEPAVGKHQSGHNSGVLHSGIYYTPGSNKATMSAAGKEMMEEFLAEEEIAYDLCGKVIVAKHESELPKLQKILDNGQANGVECELIEKERLHEIEPHVNGIKAVHVPKTGIADYPAVAWRLAEKITEMGGEVRTSVTVTGIDERATEVTVETDAGEFQGDYAVGCAGLYSDRVAKMTSDADVKAQIVPFRGEYYQLIPEANHLCKGLIYPVPDPRFPFLGVHFTKMIEGGVDCGPNAVLALSREGYTWGDFNAADLWEALSYSGFRNLAFKYWRYGLGEMWRSLNKAAFVRALQELIPAIRANDLEPHPAGVRAQALLPSGDLVYDFEFVVSQRVVHVVNAPSPAATVSLMIGKHVVEKLRETFEPHGV
ncbi:MAG: L-2-hydroxyglutarate oxidase [Chloroflexota bacterium]